MRYKRERKGRERKGKRFSSWKGFGAQDQKEIKISEPLIFWSDCFVAEVVHNNNNQKENAVVERSKSESKRDS